MHDGWLLVPLTAKFAFISPSKLVIVMPLLALLPIGFCCRSAAAGRAARAGLVRRLGRPVRGPRRRR